MPYVKYGFHCTDFNETCKSPAALHRHFLQLILPKLGKKYQMYGNSFYAPMKSITVTDLIFMEHMPVPKVYNFL